jgi:hypothetical protein
MSQGQFAACFTLDKTMHLSVQPKWFVIACALVFLCGVLLVTQSKRTAEHAERLPSMTCDELVQNGPAGNQFIKLTDVRLCARGDAFRRDMDAAIEMYVPIYSARLNQEPQPADLKLLLEVLDDRERDHLLSRPEAGELTVELWTAAAQLDPWVSDRLGNLYPGIQVANARVVSVGLHEPSALRANSQWHQGVWLIVMAIAGQAGWWIWHAAAKRYPHLVPTASNAVAVRE